MYKETENIIKKLESKYGTLAVNSAFSYVIEVGKDNFDAESVANIKEDIEAEVNRLNKEGKPSIVSAKYQCAIVDISFKLSKLPTLELLAYVQDNMLINVGQESLNKNRLETLFKNTLSIMYSKYDIPDDFVDLLQFNIGMNDYECVKILSDMGLSDVANKYFEIEDNDKDITDD